MPGYFDFAKKLAETQVDPKRKRTKRGWLVELIEGKKQEFSVVFPISKHTVRTRVQPGNFSLLYHGVKSPMVDA